MNTQTQHTTKYKNSPLGLIPEDWEVKLLGELGDFSKGKGITKEQLSESGFPCIRYGEIYTTHDFIIKEFNSFISERVAFESKEIKKGDILFAGSGETIEEIGKAVAYLGDEKAFTGGDVIILNTNDEVNVECVVYALEIDSVKKQKRVLGQGNSVVHIYSKDLSKLRLPIPPLLEQNAIADCLATWDKAIEKYNVLIAQKELSKKALMQQLLSGKKRLKGFNGDWKSFELNKICKISKGEQFNKIELDKVGQYPSFSGGIEPSGYTDKWNTDKDTIIISEGGNSCGHVNFINTKFWCGGHCYALLNIKGEFFKMFLFHSLKYNENKIMKLRVGSGLPNVQKKDLERFCLIIPSIEEQKAIANVLQCADDELQILKKKLEQLKEQKKGLMQVLLTGKKRLKY